MGWHYQACRRTYVDLMGNEETFVELVEAFPDVGPDCYTQEAVTIDVDFVGDDSRAELARWLRQAAADVEKYPLLVDPDPVKTND